MSSSLPTREAPSYSLSQPPTRSRSDNYLLCPSIRIILPGRQLITRLSVLPVGRSSGCPFRHKAGGPFGRSPASSAQSFSRPVISVSADLSDGISRLQRSFYNNLLLVFFHRPFDLFNKLYYCLFPYHMGILAICGKLRPQMY